MKPYPLMLGYAQPSAVTAELAAQKPPVGDRKFEVSNASVASSLHRLVVVGGVTIRTRVARIDVGAGEKGTVVLFMQSKGTRGKLERGLEFSTSDPKMKLVYLRAQVTCEISRKDED